VKSIQVKHSRELGREHRERERESEMLQIGERGREWRCRKKTAWVLNWGLNQHKVFLDMANGHINTKIF
jgi:hypothetical protein